MKLKYHPHLSVEKWRVLAWDKRILHIASEMSRTKQWIQEKEETPAMRSLERALELTDLTLETALEEKRDSFLKEFLRFREMLASFYAGLCKDEQEFVLLMKQLLDLNPLVHNLHLEL